MSDARVPHVVIIGGGFAGLEAARTLRRAPVRVTLVDKENHHLFQPLLYQVATAVLAAPDIAAPIRRVLRRQENATVLLAEVSGISTSEERVWFSDGDSLSYDFLIVATGASHAYFGHDEWAEHAPGLKTIADAFEIRQRVLAAFEAAEREPDPVRRRELLTFVVVGGGPTGVELAGAIAEIAFKVMARDFRHFDPREARVVLVEALERVLAVYPPELSASAVAQLAELGVEVRVRTPVTGVDEGGVMLGDERIPSRTVLWAAGVRGSELGASLPAERLRSGRVKVNPDLTVDARGDVFVVGDLAYLEVDGRAVPALAPAAKQMGRHAAKNVLRVIDGEPTRPFRYRDRGSLATIGRSRAVGVIGRLELTGFIAWFVWLFVHLLYLVGFRNRLMVLLEWAWAYLTAQRSARVIIQSKPEMRRLIAPHDAVPRQARPGAERRPEA